MVKSKTQNKDKSCNTILKDKKFMILYYFFFTIFFLFLGSISFLLLNSVILTVISLSLSVLSLILNYYLIVYFHEYVAQIETVEKAKKHDLYVIKWLYGPWFLLPLSWFFFQITGKYVLGVDSISTTFYIVYTVFLFFYTIYVVVHSYELKKKFDLFL
ncbi:Uncharacterised protein [uncultured archaeon]|nr:Uncharacterised protein [uncultured archaeon]